MLALFPRTAIKYTDVALLLAILLLNAFGYILHITARSASYIRGANWLGLFASGYSITKLFDDVSLAVLVNH